MNERHRTYSSKQTDKINREYRTMLKKISVDLIEYTLSNYDHIESSYYETQKSMVQELARLNSEENKDELIQLASLPGIDDTGSHNRNPNSVESALSSVERIKYSIHRDLLEQFMVSRQEYETRKRIYACYLALPTREKSVLKILYMDGSGVAYRYKYNVPKAMKILDRAESSITRIRRDALEHIILLYDTDYPTIELYKVDINTMRLKEYR